MPAEPRPPRPSPYFTSDSHLVYRTLENVLLTPLLNQALRSHH